MLHFDGRDGRPGGAAVAGVGGPVSSSPQPRRYGGADGDGGCTRRSSRRDRCGTDGIGGPGGAANSGPRAGWVATTLAWEDGAGGNTNGGNRDGGAGGGGYGGGAAGPGGSVFGLGVSVPRGGGSGGSYATASTIAPANPPVIGQDNPPSPSTGGAFVMTFDFCSYDDTLPLCTPDTVP